MPDPLDDRLGVVDRAVVGALLDHRGAEGALFLPSLLVLDERVVADALAQGRLVEVEEARRTDESMRIAVRGQEDRYPAAEQQRAVMRGLVVVAVEEDDIVLRDEIAKDDLVRGRRAVQHEIGLFRAEDRCRRLLRGERRTLMGEEIAKLENRIVEVVAKDRLAEMFPEDAADRTAAVKNSAIMARAGPKLVAFLGVIHEGAEEGRLEGFGI